MASRPVLDRRRLAGPEATVQPVWTPPLPPLLDENLCRDDGRYPEQMRPYLIKKGIISRANGSAYVELGATKLTCAVYGPRSSSSRLAVNRAYQSTGKVNCEIEFAPFSSFHRRPYQRDEEEAELSLVLQNSLEPAVRTDLFPNAHVDIFITVLEDDGSVLPAAIMAASAALSHAQIEMYDSVVACSAMVVDSLVIVDPTKQELQVTNENRALFMAAIMPNLNRVTQTHSIGKLSPSLYQETLNTALDGSRTLYQSTLLPVLTSTDSF